MQLARALKYPANLLLLTSMVSIAACKIERCPEEAPELKFYRFEYSEPTSSSVTATDTLTLLFEFIDCQGDVGIPSGSSTKNLQTKLYFKSSGDWVEFVTPDSTLVDILHAQIPEAKKLKKNQKVEGIIEQPINSPASFGADTIRFETVLIDVAGNKSEVVTTPEFVIPN